MRSTVLGLIFVLHGCASIDEPADQPAELEDASATEDPTDPPDAVDDSADLAEVDDVAGDALDDTTIIARVGQFQNPVAASCADPGVIRTAGPNGPVFYAACTGGNFPLFKSTDLVHWSAAGHLFHSAPAWTGGNNWAPEIHHIGTGYVAYYAALSPSRHKMCIGAARATTAEGPYTDLGHPLACDAHVSLIDPNVFTDGSGRHFLYYKTDGNALRPQEKTIIYGHELRADGLGFVGVRHRLLKNTLGWEGDVVEAPWVMHRGRYYFMFYSGYRYCDHTYGVGVARATSPLGPFHKRSAPILHSNDKWTGPGHNSIVPSGGHDFIVYHAWRGAHACGESGNRELLIDWVTWRGGWPFINSGSPSRGVHTAPPVP
jgi:arabinan endo-1,5-alpha-L-arabinosidase